MESQANNQELFTMPAVTRNAFNTNGKKISVATNLFTFVFRQTDQNEFFTFALIFEPEIPGDAIRLKTKLFSLLRPSLPAELYGNVILSGMNFIGTMRGPDGEAEVTLDDIPYKITYKLAKTFKANDTESESLYKRFFASLVRKMNFVTIRKNYYNPSCGKKLQNGNLDLWPGFNFTINRLDNRILLSMNLTYRVIRKETALDLIKKEESKISRQDSVEARLTEALKGLVVITRYGKERCYIVDSVVTSMDINSTFPARDKDGNLSEVSFKDYYQQKYRINLREGQPLLKIIEKRRGVENTIYLIPELCLLSGITDDMRANFNLMKEMNTFTKGVPKEKLDECKNLIDSVKNYEKCRSEIEKWGMTIDTTPVNFNAVKLDAGNLMLGNKQVSSNDPGLDRNVQTVMFSQPGLKVWGIFYMKNDQKLYDEFYNNFKESCRTYQYNVQPPKLFPMNSNRSGDWEAELSKIKNLEIDLLLFIIPGSRGKGPLYDYIKRYCTCETSIPTQCILTGTLSKGKGLRSITNKVLVQMCAKIGGIPWVIDNLPFTNMPTMIIGIDSTGSKNSMLGFTASLCRNFSTYFSRAVNIQSDDLREVRELTKQALETFLKRANILPKHIIILRDGVSLSDLKPVATKEICQMKLAFEDVKDNDIKLTYVSLNKRTNLKVFTAGARDFTAEPGTLIDNTVTSGDDDFYLIPAKATQGVPSAIHYRIVYDSLGIDHPQMQSLVYKLCWTYYNWTGSIKVPAPCQYARKLSTLISDKLKNQPNDRFNSEKNFLYYL